MGADYGKIEARVVDQLDYAYGGRHHWDRYMQRWILDTEGSNRRSAELKSVKEPKQDHKADREGKARMLYGSRHQRSTQWLFR